jgi:hypothetical protein
MWQIENILPELASKRFLAHNAKSYASCEMPLPEGFVLPDDLIEIQAGFLSNSMPVDGIWIAKPSGASQGKGIQVFKGLNEAINCNRRKHCVVQRYIEPLLMDGFKFDFRLYVFITSFYPIEAYIHELGYARFCGKQYDTSTLDDRFAHLTNVSVNKNACRSQSYVRIETVWQELAKQGVDVPSVQANVRDALRKVLLSTEAAVSQKATSSSSGSADDERKHFQLIGFDVLLDKEHNPIVLEANTSPDIFELEMEQQLIFDMLTMLFHPPAARHGACDEQYESNEGQCEEEVNFKEAQTVVPLPNNADCCEASGLLTMRTVIEDWDNGGDQLVCADEWCSDHWRWSPTSTGKAAAPEEGRAGKTSRESRGFSSLF